MSSTFAIMPMRARRFLTALFALLAVLLGPPPGTPGRAAPTVGDWGGSLAGRLVVASENMGDPRFRNTVILMVEHDAGGAMGLIVNVPIGVIPVAPLFERLGLVPPAVAPGAAPGVAPGAEGEIAVYYGGPVENERGFLLHSADVVVDGSILVGEGVAMTGEAEMLDKIGRGEGPERSLFAFGYSGWGPQQLESEFARDAWFTIPFDPALVFAVDPARSWARAAARRGLDL
jgi:putative transcriptional regulator